MRLVRTVGLTAVLAGAVVGIALGQVPATPNQAVTPRTYYKATHTATGDMQYEPVTEFVAAQDAAPVPAFPTTNPYGPYQWHPEAAQLAQQYVKSEKDGDKREIRRKLTHVLTQQFDQHLEQQKKELEALEKQIDRLRSVLEKRRENKEKIIDRRIEQLVQEAEGLGWNAPNSPPTFYPPPAVYTAPVRVPAAVEKKSTTRKREKRGESENDDNGIR
jgi:hypothetical protein